MLTRTSLVVALLFGARAAVGAADPGVITPEQLVKAEATYREVFADEHAKATKATKPAEKSKFAKKLLERCKQSESDPALAEVLRRNALAFAQTDKEGLEVALEIHKANMAVPVKRRGAAEKYAEVLEKSIPFEPVANRGKVGGEVVKVYRDVAAEHEQAGNAAAALAAVEKARTAARKYTPTDKDAFGALAADEKRLQPLAAEQKELDRLERVVEKTPTDAKSRVALACGYLRAGRGKDAAPHLAAAGADEWAALGAALTRTPVPVAAVELCVKAAGTLPADDRKNRGGVLEYARLQCEACRAGGGKPWADTLPRYVEILDKLSGLDPASKSGATECLVSASTELVEVLIDKGDATGATATLAKARSALKALKAAEHKDLTDELDATERWVKARFELEAEVVKLRAAAATPKGQAKLGLALLRLGKTADAIPHLSAAESKACVALAKLLGADKADPLEVADALHAVGSELTGGEQNDLFVLARERYEEFLAKGSKDPALARVRLRMEKLPGVPTCGPERRRGAATVLIDENPDLVDVLKKGNDRNNCTWDRSNPFSGRGCLVVRPNVALHTVPGWSVPIRPADGVTPQRFLRFAWRMPQGESAVLHLYTNKGETLTYTVADKQAGVLPAADKQAGVVPIADRPSAEWTVVTRDLAADFPSAAGAITGVYVILVGTGAELWIDQLQFAAAVRDFQRPTKKAAK